MRFEEVSSRTPRLLEARQLERDSLQFLEPACLPLFLFTQPCCQVGASLLGRRELSLSRVQLGFELSSLRHQTGRLQSCLLEGLLEGSLLLMRGVHRQSLIPKHFNFSSVILDWNRDRLIPSVRASVLAVSASAEPE